MRGCWTWLRNKHRWFSIHLLLPKNGFFFNENVNFLLRTHLCRIICEYLNASYRSLYCQCLFVVRKIDAAKGHTTTYVSSKHTHTLHKTHLCLMNIKWHFNLSFIGCEGLPLCIQMNSLFVKERCKDGTRWEVENRDAER